MQTIGFAGLGRMGAPMARRLLDAGFDVTVWNRSERPADELIRHGARVVRAPAELASDAGIVITMLAGPPAVEAVVGQLLEGAPPRLVVVDMSTIGPRAARSLAARAAAVGVEFVDAPVSGSVSAAEAGALACFAGGRAEAVDRARPALAPLTASVTYVGESGAGAAVKLGLNTVLALLNQGIAEALALAEAEGVDPATMYDALEHSAVGAPFVAYKRAAFLEGDAAGVAFTIAGLAKDLDLALAHAGARGVPLFAAGAVRQALVAVAGLGMGGDDIAAVRSALRRLGASSAS